MKHRTTVTAVKSVFYPCVIRGSLFLLIAGTICLLQLPANAADEKADEAVVKIITLGDSITKGVRPGVKPEETFAALVEAGLKKEGIAAQVINVGIGGERTDQ